MTWEPNVAQKIIPDEHEMMLFLKEHCSDATFQYEKGLLKGKIHIQGVITYSGPRISKVGLLNVFRTHFGNIGGLTISQVYDKVAIAAYVTKEEGRVKGPFFLDNTDQIGFSMRNQTLKPWQQELFNILTSDELASLKDRKVIWVEDISGNTGKSWFQKWLRLGQTRLIVRSLPVSNVDRLMSAVHIISKKLQVDAYCIDLTRTKGEDQSYKDLFSSVEQIKNGCAIDLMYGKYNESYFNPPVVMIFTNEKITEFIDYLSKDRWVLMKIKDNHLYRVCEKYPYIKRVSPDDLTNSAIATSSIDEIEMRLENYNLNQNM